MVARDSLNVTFPGLLYLMKSKIFGKKITEHKIYVLIFLRLLTETFCNSQKNSVEYYHKFAHVFMQSTRYSCQILMKLEPTRHILMKLETSRHILMKLEPSRHILMKLETSRHILMKLEPT